MSQSARHPLVGTIVIDTTCGARYAVGATGFLQLSDGSFVSYDSAFPGPQFFEADVFMVEVNREGQGMSQGAAECLDTLHYHWTRFSEATSPVSAAYALTELNDAVGDMATWHPGYQYEHDSSQMPWQRNILD